MTKYRNQWHNPKVPHYGPAEYVTDVESKPHRGFDIYQRLSEVFDVVQDGVCVGQFAGYNGAVTNIDAYLDGADFNYLSIAESNEATSRPGI